MKIFGQEVDPYDLFLILILLLAGTGFFAPPEDEGDPKAKDNGTFFSFFELLRGPKKNASVKRRNKKPGKVGLKRAKILPMGLK